MHSTRRQFTRSALLASAGGILLPPSLWAQAITYKVKKGDTLGKIALHLNTSTSELKGANNLSSDLIRVGQKLTIPTGGNTNLAEYNPSAMSNYIVVKGDTLGKIAQLHAISIRELKAANNLSRDLILVGQNLRIPRSAVMQTALTKDLMAPVRAATADIKIQREKWQRIVVHHSAIKYGNVEKYDAAHRLRGMQNGLAYHFLIGNGIDAGDGEIEIGPRWQKQQAGGHVKNHLINQTAIGICLIGNFEKTRPSREQLDAFTQLMDWLVGVALGKKVHFAGHRELKGEQTVCPGKHFPLALMHARYD
ncbi:MAG: LysM peptidoglycan-binding domain-containing protein [Verrucomicrobiota bacterium]|nr:LysM peptidoglycan-binding domain-containing protein [Verrucomicrobiota bacterium]